MGARPACDNKGFAYADFLREPSGGAPSKLPAGAVAILMVRTVHRGVSLEAIAAPASPKSPRSLSETLLDHLQNHDGIDRTDNRQFRRFRKAAAGVPRLGGERPYVAIPAFGGGWEWVRPPCDNKGFARRP